MNDLVIKTHDFELAKSELKEFSEKKAEELAIKGVKEGGWFFGFGNHKVTGSEFNERMTTIQQHLIDLNNTNNQTIKEFGKVYNALEALDRDYIQAILIAVKGAEETSKGVAATQDKIKIVVDNQKKTVETLFKFKEKLDTYSHLGDIDRIWNDCQQWHEDIINLSNSLSDVIGENTGNTKSISDIKNLLENMGEKTSRLFENLSEESERLDKVICFINELKEMSHLNDIDNIWDSLSNAHEYLKNLGYELETAKTNIENHQKIITKISEFVETLSGYEHLNEIDSTWYKVEENIKKIDCLTELSNNTIESVKKNQTEIVTLNEYKKKLSSYSHLGDVDTMWDKIENNIVNIDNLTEQGNNTIESVKKNQTEIVTLNEYKKKLSSYSHLGDVDTMWDKIENNIVNIDSLTEQANNTIESVKEICEDISILFDYKKRLSSYVHLEDVDDLWDSNEKHSEQIEELQNRDEETINLIQQNKELADSALADEHEKTETVLQQLNKKIKISFWIAGGSLVLALTELLVILLG